MEWINDPRLWVALTPAGVFIGAAVAFYLATEQGEEASPPAPRGASEWEPWGVPVFIKKYRLPGDSVYRSNRVIEHDTAVFTVIKDERK